VICVCVQGGGGQSYPVKVFNTPQPKDNYLDAALCATVQVIHMVETCEGVHDALAGVHVAIPVL
jgi:hypothetical protein